MLAKLDQLFLARDLLWTWTGRIIRARYQQSVLGWLWVIIQPVTTVAVFTVIFTLFVPVNTGNTPYVVFSYVALIPWMLIANSLPDMANSLVSNMQLVTKIYFPREILPLSSLLARLLDFMIAVGLLVVLIIYFRIPIFPVGWLFLPIILIIHLMLIIGLGLILAASNIFYRDVGPLLGLGIQLWFYASPIVYPVTLVPEWLRPYYFMNPVAGILEAYRAVFLYQSLPGLYLFNSGLLSLFLLLTGYWFFKRVEFQFADIV
jgi:lipopolysaccharide transport system permease protein